MMGGLSLRPPSQSFKGSVLRTSRRLVARSSDGVFKAVVVTCSCLIFFARSSDGVFDGGCHNLVPVWFFWWFPAFEVASAGSHSKRSQFSILGARGSNTDDVVQSIGQAHGSVKPATLFPVCTVCTRWFV